MTSIISQIKLQTNERKKMTVKGQTETFIVYKVPLENLYYNENNDRISTFISQYQGKIKSMSFEQRNDEIESFIVASDRTEHNKTKRKIKEQSQMEAGVITHDGRVIDGNRRFTCLRQLYKETKKAKWQYFNCVVLDGKYKDLTEKDFKEIEYNLQFNTGARVDYDNIEKLSGMYKNVIIEGLNDNKSTELHMTVDEYLDSKGEKPQKFKEDLRILKIMISYLKWINKDQQFHIARNEQLYDAFKTTSSFLESVKVDEETKMILRNYCFTIMKTKIKREDQRAISLAIGEFARQFKKHPNLVEVNTKLEKFVEIVDEKFDHIITNSDEYNKSVKKELSQINIDISRDFNRTLTKNKPNLKVKEAIKDLKSIDTSLFKSWKVKETNEFEENLNILEECVGDLRKAFDEEF